MTLSAYAAALAGALLLPAGMLALAGCSQAQVRSAETALVSLGDTACKAFLPMALKTGASLVCDGAAEAITMALDFALSQPVPSSPSFAGAGGVSEPVRVPRALLVNGKLAALVPLTAAERESAQAKLDAAVVRGSR